MYLKFSGKYNGLGTEAWTDRQDVVKFDFVQKFVSTKYVASLQNTFSSSNFKIQLMMKNVG